MLHHFRFTYKKAFQIGRFFMLRLILNLLHWLGSFMTKTFCFYRPSGSPISYATFALSKIILESSKGLSNLPLCFVRCVCATIYLRLVFAIISAQRGQGNISV